MKLFQMHLNRGGTAFIHFVQCQEKCSEIAMKNLHKLISSILSLKPLLLSKYLNF